MLNLQENKRIVRKMIQIYCKAHHSAKSTRKKKGNEKSTLCPECTELTQYAFEKLEKCPWRDSKPVCSNCPIHCYSESKRTQIRTAMRYSGPRIFWAMPFLSLKYLLVKKLRKPTLDEFREIARKKQQPK